MDERDQNILGPLSIADLREMRQQTDRLSVIALGTFDGVHTGHQAILGEAVALKEYLRTARPDAEIETVAFTFDKLPLEVLRPEQAPARLNSMQSRCSGILAKGIDRVVMAEFDSEFASVNPHVFVNDILFGAFNVAAIVVGFNHTFGYQGKGNVETLRAVAKEHGVDVAVVGQVTVEGEVVSSTRIRGLLLDGACEHAATLLGKPYFLDGHVVDGHKKGRLLGYPTANLEPQARLLIPADGVYLTRAETDGQCLGYALTIVSDRPTFHGGVRSIETYILDFSGDLYGRALRIHFLRYLRPITRFSDPDELKRQIAQDVTEARRAIAQLALKHVSGIQSDLP